MKLFSNKKPEEIKYDMSIKIKMCPQHLDFCKMGTKKVQVQQVIALLHMIQVCRGCKVVVE